MKLTIYLWINSSNFFFNSQPGSVRRTNGFFLNRIACRDLHPACAVMGSGLPCGWNSFNERMGRLPGRGGAERSLSCASSRSWQPPLAIPLPASGTGGNACCCAIRRGRDAGHDRHLFRVCGCWSLSWHGLLAAGRNALFVGSHCIAVCLFLHIRTCNIRFSGGSLRGKWAAKKASFSGMRVLTDMIRVLSIPPSAE
jgi:hypothetical protein